MFSLLFSHVFLIFIALVSAHSPPPKPLRAITHPSTDALEIVARKPSLNHLHHRREPPPDRLRHSDTFRLILSAFDTKFHLHLRPNDHLIHPAARINHYYHNADGQNVLSHTTPLVRESVLVYQGQVFPESLSDDRLRFDAAGVVPQTGQGEIGWARIIVYSQGDASRGIAPVYEGAFSAHGVIHHVMTKDRYLRTKHPLDPHVVQPLDDIDSSLVIWRDSDIMTEHEETNFHGGVLSSHPLSCGHDDSEHTPTRQPATTPWYNPFGYVNSTLTRRQNDIPGMDGMNTNYADRIGNTAGCPKSQRVIYMGVAADCKYVQQHGGNAESTTNQILNNWNTASALYKDTFNVSLGIIELAIQSASCPAQADPNVPWNVDCGSVTINDRLGLFSQWRGQKGKDGAGLWHLMSGCPTGTEVGIAWLDTACVTTASGSGVNTASGTGVSTGGRVEWQVVAHEIGHNFGAIHDCTTGCTGTTQCCPSSANSCDAGGRFIMNPTASQGENTFSPCSIGNICTVLGGGGSRGPSADSSCFVDPATSNQQIISLQMCGNGIVESGEDCDPGPNSNSTCCDPQTCKFRNGAQCDPESSPCCTSSCSFAPSTQVCRPSKDDRCDTPEMCTGSSSSCPADTFAPNGQSCGNNGLQCASGTCTSVAQQCQTVGASLGLKEACPSRDNSCQVSCQDPKQANACVLLQALLVDGSPCGYGGTCVSGECKSGNFLDTAKSWYTSNLQIAIPVTIVVGIIVLMILSCLIRAIFRCARGRPTTTVISPHTRAQHQRLLSVPQHGHGMAPPPTHPRNAEWVDDRAYNGSGYNGYNGYSGYPGR